MVVVNADMSISLTRGDRVTFTVTAEKDGQDYVFQPGDLLRMKVFEKKDCEAVVLQKDFPVSEATGEVGMTLEAQDTKLGGVIHRPRDYWYEIELNPLSEPQTILGYDDNGPKVFRLFPEGRDLEEEEIPPEELPTVDPELDLTSGRPVQNQAVARAVAELCEEIGKLKAEFSEWKEGQEG